MFSWFRGYSFEEQVQDFDEKINQVATSLIKSVQEDLPIGQYDLASLQDMDTCNQYVVFLGEELDKRFKKVEIDQISNAIYVGKRKKKSQTKANNVNANNYVSGENTFNKKELCQQISSHYVRTFNLLAAILTAIDPNKNMCTRRLEALYQTVETDKDSGHVRTCPADDLDKNNPLYPDHISQVPGIQQLLNLYYFYLSQDNDHLDKDQKGKIREEFEKLYQAFSEVFVSSDLEAPVVKELNQAVNQVNSNLEQLNKAETSDANKEAILELTTLVTGLKEQLDQFQEETKAGQSQKDQEVKMEEMKNTIVSTIKDQLHNTEEGFQQQMQELQNKVDVVTQQQQEQQQKQEEQEQQQLENTPEVQEESPQVLEESPDQSLNSNLASPGNDLLTSEENQPVEGAPLNQNQAEQNQVPAEEQKLSEENGMMVNMSLNSEGTPQNKAVNSANNGALSNSLNSLNNSGNLNLGENPSLGQNNEPPAANQNQLENGEKKPEENQNQENKTPEALPLPDMPAKNSQAGGQSNDVESSRSLDNLEQELENFDLGEEENKLNENKLNENKPEENGPEINKNNAPAVNSDATPLRQFLSFIQEYNKEFDVPEEYQLNLRPKTVSEISEKYECTSEPSQVTIQLDDKKYKEFRKVYKKMKDHYLSMSSKLLGIMEDSIIKAESNSYSLRPLTSSQLNTLQTKVMKNLTEYYTKCQGYYQDAFSNLSDAILAKENSNEEEPETTNN